VFRPRGGNEKVLVSLLARERAPLNAHRDLYMNWTGQYLTGPLSRGFAYRPGPKFTDNLRTVLRQFSDLQQFCDNWRIHRTFTAVLRPIFQDKIFFTITF